MDSSTPEALEQLCAENQRLRAQIAAMTAPADSARPTSRSHPPDPPLWFDAVSDAIIVTDATWHIQHWNQTAAQIYGWPQEAVIGRAIAEIVPVVSATDGPLDASALEVLTAAGAWRGEVVQHTRDGCEVAIDSSVRVFTDDHGAITGYIAINRDITKHIYTEAALRVARRAFRRSGSRRAMRWCSLTPRASSSMPTMPTAISMATPVRR